MRKRLRGVRCLRGHTYREATLPRILSDDLRSDFPGVHGYYFNICRVCGKIQIVLLYERKGGR